MEANQDRPRAAAMPNRVSLAVTGADGQVGRALLERLADRGVETIALTREAANLPAGRVIAGPLDAPAAQAALREAEVIVHLAGTLHPTGRNSYHAANVATTVAVADALRSGNARRVLFLSYVGAGMASENLYLRAKAQAERLLQETGKEVVIFRCTHIIGPPEAPGPTATAMLAPPGGKVNLLGDGGQVVAPVCLGDVVSALLAAVDGGPPGIYELTGPERMTMDHLARLLNRNPEVAIAHLPAWLARLMGRVLPALPGPLVETMLNDSVGDASAAVTRFGLKLMPLGALWGGLEPPCAGQRSR
jgi:NADH dehydrogenase